MFNFFYRNSSDKFWFQLKKDIHTWTGLDLWDFLATMDSLISSDKSLKEALLLLESKRDAAREYDRYDALVELWEDAISCFRREKNRRGFDTPVAIVFDTTVINILGNFLSVVLEQEQQIGRSPYRKWLSSIKPVPLYKKKGR